VENFVLANLALVHETHAVGEDRHGGAVQIIREIDARLGANGRVNRFGGVSSEQTPLQSVLNCR